MSKAYKCDICGSLFETINCVKIDKNNIAYLELGGTRYDICPNCISAIQSTINGLSPLKEVCGKVHNNLEANE